MTRQNFVLKKLAGLGIAFFPRVIENGLLSFINAHQAVANLLVPHLELDLFGLSDGPRHLDDSSRRGIGLVRDAVRRRPVVDLGSATRAPCRGTGRTRQPRSSASPGRSTGSSRPLSRSLGQHTTCSTGTETDVRHSSLHLQRAEEVGATGTAAAGIRLAHRRVVDRPAATGGGAEGGG